jgi:Ca2+-binding RTX toxin-like protein
MRYSANTSIGDGPAQSVTVTLTGTTFTIDDIVPIHAGSGCRPVEGDGTQVTCVAYKTAPNGSFKPFTVIMSGGDDKARNLAAAPMQAHGGAGSDRLIGGNLADKLKGDSGNDTLEGLGGDDEILGGTGLDWMYGDDGNDDLYGLQDRDRLKGGNGDDLLEGGSEADVIIGGTNVIRDTVSYRHSDFGVTVNLADPNALQGMPGEGDLVSEVENVDGSEFDDTIYGNAGTNNLWGWGGNDEIHGAAGQDLVLGGFGSDHLTPSYGPDGVADHVDCDDFGDTPSDGNNGDLAVRYRIDGDFVRNCESIIDL